MISSKFSCLRAVLCGVFASLLLAPLAQAQDLSQCDTQFVSSSNGAIRVAANGADDTDNIACALDAAAASGVTTVKLANDDYYIGQLTVSNFNGTLEGTTRANSTLTILDRSVDCDAMEDAGQTASAIKFVGGEPRVRFLTINVDEPCTQGSSANVLYVLHFTGQPTGGAQCGNDVAFGNVDRVDMFDMENGPNAGRNRAFGALPEAFHLGGCKDTLLGTFKFNRSTVNGFLTGGVTSVRGTGQVDVNFNEFRQTANPLVIEDANQSTSVVGNVFDKDANDQYRFVGVSVIAGDNAPASNRVVINGNTFNLGGTRQDYATGVFTEASEMAFNNGASASVIVSNNRFFFSGFGSIGQDFRAFDGTQVTGNQHSGPQGAFATGTTLFPEHGQLDDFALLGNSYQGYSVDFADILLYENTSNNLVGAMQTDRILDFGDNILLDDLLPLPVANAQSSGLGVPWPVRRQVSARIGGRGDATWLLHRQSLQAERH